MSPAAPRPKPAGARDQVARLLTLVPWLHARGEVTLDEAARTLGVTPRQLVKDLNVLFLCGLPGGYPDDLIEVDLDAVDPEGDGSRLQGEGVIRVSNADYLLRPLRLTPTEATSVIVALRALRNRARDASTRALVDRTVAKLEGALAEGAAAARIDPGDDPIADHLDALQARLEDAVARGHQVRLSYLVASRDEVTERVVDPRGVVTTDGFRYLDAWCHLAQGDRLFRLDRIREAVELDTPVEHAEPPRDLAPGAAPAEGTLVTLRLQPAARWVVEYVAVREVRPGPDGTTDVDLLVADPRWLERLWLRLAPAATILEPVGYGSLFEDAARAALALYGDSQARVVE